MTPDDEGWERLDASGFDPVYWSELIVHCLHPTVNNRRGHCFHEATHDFLTVVVADPYARGILGGHHHHETVFRVVGRTRLDTKLPVFVALWFRGGEVAGVRIANHIVNNIGCLWVNGLNTFAWFPFSHRFISGVSYFHNVCLGNIQAIA